MVARATITSNAALPLGEVLRGIDNSLKRSLDADADNEAKKPNQEPREVFGQWVEVTPTALPDPFLVSLSPAMAAELDLDPAAAADPLFARVFSGDVSALPADVALQPWATPYAVSVFGQPIPSPDPFGGGNAYGDGRALSLLVKPWEKELQDFALVFAAELPQALRVHACESRAVDLVRPRRYRERAQLVVWLSDLEER